MFWRKATRKPRRAKSNLRRNGKRLRVEGLESRTMLDSNGLLLTNDAYLTLSFADDGVEVAGQSNTLAAEFDSLAPFAVWQATILRAFQAWTSRTNADIGVVDDGGQPFGSAGNDRGDSQFGDVRIAAIAMSPEIGAVSVPMNGIVGGSWTADVIFNTNFVFQSLDDLYAIALHEAGNVLGLADSADPLSPLHPGPIPTATVPTATDVLNLQSLYGIRLADLNEASDGEVNNNSFNDATRLRLNDYTSENEYDSFGDGSAPSLVYGDLRTIGDIDYFRLETPDNYVGPVTFQLRSAGISLLAPELTIYSEQQQLVQAISSTSTTGDIITITLPSSANNDSYVVKVATAAADWRAIGGYSLVVTFDQINQISPEIMEKFADGSLRKLEQSELRKLFDTDDDDEFRDDSHTDDDPFEAVELESENGFASPTRFEIIGSITDDSDQDYYRIRAPETGLGTGVLTIAIRSMEAGTLVPKLAVLDHDRHPVSANVLANGAGQLVVQIADISPDEYYYLKVSAVDPSGPFATGNYQLTASFAEKEEILQPFAAGTLAVTSGQNVHTLYVAEPQLFHFALQSDPVNSASPHMIAATFFDASNQTIHRLATSPGDIRSLGAVLLSPGTYKIVMSAGTLHGSAEVSINYQLNGFTISDPFVSDPTDPTTQPFQNPDPSTGGAYLYPNNTPSDASYLWDEFIASLPELPPPLPTAEMVAMLMRDWWPWYWSQIGVAGPPLALTESYTTPVGAPFSVSIESGVLGNDVEPDGTPMGVILVTGPRSGELVLNSDGSFQYTPEAGFNGVVRFTYQTTDFSQMSNEVSVIIVVGIQGDYDGSGIVSQNDHGVWRSNFGSTSIDGDGNGDGVVDAADYVIWRKHMSSQAAVAAVPVPTLATSAGLTAAPSLTEPAAAPSSVDSRELPSHTVAAVPKTANREIFTATVVPRVKTELMLAIFRSPFETATNQKASEATHDAAIDELMGSLDDIQEATALARKAT
jgi:hypothetical protein